MLKVKKSLRLPLDLLNTLEAEAAGKGKEWYDLLLDIAVDYFTPSEIVSNDNTDNIEKGFLGGWITADMPLDLSPMSSTYDIDRPVKWESLLDNNELIEFNQYKDEINKTWYYDDVCWIVTWVWYQLFRHARRPPTQKFKAIWNESHNEHPAYAALRIASAEVPKGHKRFTTLVNIIPTWIKEDLI